MPDSAQIENRCYNVDMKQMLHRNVAVNNKEGMKNDCY